MAFFHLFGNTSVSHTLLLMSWIILCTSSSPYLSNSAGISSDPGDLQSFRILMALVVSSVDRSFTLSTTSWPVHSGTSTSSSSLLNSSSKRSLDLCYLIYWLCTIFFFCMMPLHFLSPFLKVSFASCVKICVNLALIYSVLELHSYMYCTMFFITLQLYIWRLF